MSSHSVGSEYDPQNLYVEARIGSAHLKSQYWDGETGRALRLTDQPVEPTLWALFRPVRISEKIMWMALQEQHRRLISALSMYTHTQTHTHINTHMNAHECTHPPTCASTRTCTPPYTRMHKGIRCVEEDSLDRGVHMALSMEAWQHDNRAEHRKSHKHMENKLWGQIQNPVRRTGMPELWDGWPGAKAAGMPKQRQEQTKGGKNLGSLQHGHRWQRQR